MGFWMRKRRRTYRLADTAAIVFAFLLLAVDLMVRDPQPAMTPAAPQGEDASAVQRGPRSRPSIGFRSCCRLYLNRDPFPVVALCDGETVGALQIRPELGAVAGPRSPAARR